MGEHDSIWVPAERSRTFQQPEAQIRKESFARLMKSTAAMWKKRRRTLAASQSAAHVRATYLRTQELLLACSSERPTETKQCSVYSQYEDSSQNKNNAFKEITARYFLRVCVCAV